MSGGTLGPYRLDRELGAGGMGKVYAARVEGRVPGLDVGTVVALKVVHPHLLETPGFFKRFLREAEIGKSVVHENVVRTYDCDSLSMDGRRADFLVMEYVEGQTLRDLLKELDRVPEELCRHIGREVAKGLAAIHAAGVVHRDMKPENVLITGDHQVKVMDLGVARLQDEAMRLSQTGAFVGSIHYAAPEAFREGGKHVDGRADLHALGLVLYELASGVNPYLADDVPQILRKVLHEEPRRLGEVNPQLSAFFEEVVHTLLVKDPRGRFASATQLLSVLDEGESSAWWHERARKLQADTRRPIRRVRIPRETAVHGREKELERLRELYEKAKAGDGQVLLLEGEAGIGKSRLVDEFVARLHVQGEDLHFLFGSYPPGGAASGAGAFSAAFHEHLGEEGAAPYLARTPLLVPAFDALLRGDVPPAGAPTLSRDAVGTCFVHALLGLAAERPTLLLVDDLHFAPEEARSLFSALAMASPGHRVLLIGSTRPGGSEEWRAGLTRLPHVATMELSRLGPKDLVRLLADSLGSRHLAEDLAGRIAAKSDGNPFFTFEILRGLRDGNFISRSADGTWTTTRVIDEIEIPSSVLDLVSARVSGLTEDERAMLDVAACCGYDFDPSLVGEILGLARIPALRAFGQLERQHRLVRSSGRRYVFDHHQVQEALYTSLNDQLREEYHAAIAATLEARAGALGREPSSLDGALCVELCEQYLLGGRGREARRYLRAAVEHVRAGHLPVRAVALAQRALDVPDLLVGGERAETLLQLEQALETLGRRDAHRAAVEEAVTLADARGEPRLRARAHWRLGHFLEREFATDAALAELERAREIALEAGDTEVEKGALSCSGLVLLHAGRYPEAERRFRELIDFFRAAGKRDEEGSAWTNLGNVMERLGRSDEAKRCYERHLQICHEDGHRAREMVAALNVGVCFAQEHRLDDALKLFELSLERARACGARSIEAVAIGNVGAVQAALRRFDEARTWHRRHLELTRELGMRDAEALAERNLGHVEWVQGRLGEARAHFARQVELARALRQRWREAEGLSFGSLVDALLGRGDRARESGLAAIELFANEGNRVAETDARFRLAIALLATDEPDAADTSVRECVAALDEHGDFAQRARVRIALAEAAIDRREPDAARSLLSEARTLAAESGDGENESAARALLGLLPGGSPEDAARALSGTEQALPLTELVSSYARLWGASRDPDHLRRARDLLDQLLARNPVELHDGIRRGLRLGAGFLAACRETPDGDLPRGTESATRSG
jgi:tetratricopeptide (TPR) repeat protein